MSPFNNPLNAIPFSRSGTYLCFSFIAETLAKRKNIPPGLWLRSIHGSGSQEVGHLELLEEGESVPFDVWASASLLTLQGPKGKAEIVLASHDTIRIRLQGACLRLDVPVFRNHGVIPEKESCWILNLAGTFRNYRVIPLSGEIAMDAPWETKRCRHIRATLSPGDKKTGEFALEQLSWMRPPQQHTESFDELAAKVEREFDDFAKPYLTCPEGMRETAQKAAYLNWSSVVPVGGKITRPAMFMSRNQMTNIWAWDHAFNALATQLTAPDLAWDQLMIMFDHQDEHGQIPDYFNDTHLLTTFVKPPIHGWILSLMVEVSGPLPRHHAEEAYEKLGKWTRWWLKFRNPDGDDLPVYWHGNDSGWDNATVFDLPFPIKSPELASFLILQMESLAALAEQLNLGEEAETWKLHSEKILNTLTDSLWDGRQFKVLSTINGSAATESDSVFKCLPIVLGKRLPQNIRKELIIEIKRHLTEWGPATENPNSSLYQSSGYWRGPIWAPPVMILVDGCHKAGEKELAMDISRRFCQLCQKSGFAENFDAISGAPLSDPAYTWTSSVFLILTQRYLSL